MATVTSLTAERMLAIEAASVVDGDIVGDNLILTTKGGSQIDAGNVRGPAGEQGPVGQDTSILSAIPILDMGMVGQIRAGRQLSAADFTDMGLKAPIGLWNLSNLNDSSGNGRNLSNKGGVTTDVGINGLGNTSAKFAGSNAQALYISDTGAADPFRLKTGSFGCWFKTTKRGASQSLISKVTTAGNTTDYSFEIMISSGNAVLARGTVGGVLSQVNGLSDVCDDRWHLVVAVADGTSFRLYLDGILESLAAMNGPFNPSGIGPLNIGGYGADAATVSGSPNFGRVDEAFVTDDILLEDQVRNLYCAKIPHTLGVVPSRVNLNVHRLRKGSSLAVTDFSSQPLRLYNFSGGSYGDEGANNVALVPQSTPPVSVADAAGQANNAYSFNATSALALMATDAGLPSALTTRSYGCWIKTTNASTSLVVLGYGATTGVQLWVNAGIITATSVGDNLAGNFISDGLWHHVIVVEDNAAADGVRRKLYVDGRLVGNSTILNTFANAGANSFRIGANYAGNVPFIGQIDGVFVHNIALTNDQILKLYLKGSQALAPSPKNAGDHVEALTATDILAVFDMLEGQHKIDLSVAP